MFPASAVARAARVWATALRGAHATRTIKTKDAPPESVVNFRNMQRRRGGAFRTNVRVASKKKSVPRLREHWYRTSHEIAEIAKGGVPEAAFHEAHAHVHTGMEEWHKLARNIRAQDRSADHLQPQLAAAAWNQVIQLAVNAGMPSAAWRTYCEMKRAHVRPTARTFAGYFAALAHAVRSRKIDVQTTRSWIEHVPKLYTALEQLSTYAAHAQPSEHDTAWLGTPATDATGGTLRPDVAAGRSRVAHETRKDPQALVAAYSAYISLLFALGRPQEALQVWDVLCPDPYPGRRAAQKTLRLPRHLIATAPTYTALLRDLGMCRMPLPAKKTAIRDVWARWQYDILTASRAQPGAPPLLDATAIKTLVWTLSIGAPSDAAKQICALLGTYCGVTFPSTPGAIQYSVPSNWRPIHFTLPMLLTDVLAFFEQQHLYAHVVDCFVHAQRTQNAPGAVHPETLPEAVACVTRAREKLSRQRT